MEATNETGKNPAGAQSRGAEGGTNLSGGLGDAHYEAPEKVWWCNFGSYGHLTLRKDEADSAREDGAQVFEYIQSPNAGVKAA